MDPWDMDWEDGGQRESSSKQASKQAEHSLTKLSYHKSITAMGMKRGKEKCIYKLRWVGEGRPGTLVMGMLPW